MWLAAAVTAMLTGLAAVRIIGDGITTPTAVVREPDEIAAALATASPAEIVAVPPSEPGSAAPVDTGSIGVDPIRTQPVDATPGPSTAAATTGTPARPTPSASRRAPVTAPSSKRPAPSTPRTTAGTPSRAATPAARSTTLRTPGGTIVARCPDGLAELVSWAPAQGFATHHARRGPAREAEVEFRGDAGEVRVTVVCRAGAPAASWEVKD